MTVETDPPPLFFSDKGVVDVDAFATLVSQVRSRLKTHSHVCNLLHDRMSFATGLAAAVLNGQPTILPPSDAPEAIAASLASVSNPIILDKSNELARASDAGGGVRNKSVSGQAMLSELHSASTSIQVFTSGTTKQPECIEKTCHILGSGAAVTEQILVDQNTADQRLAILGTTPARHMFGLEATIFAGLAFSRCIYRPTIFYPADLELAIAAARRIGRDKLVLVTSPSHLKFLEQTILSAPEICCVLSATAPLTRAQAERLEKRGDLKVMEIYGSSETGSLAFRRTAEETRWTTSAGFSLDTEGGQLVARAPHLSTPVPLGDDLEIHPDGRFELLGRKGDMITIHGKRSRLSALNSVLSETPGLADGVCLHSPKGDTDRLAIVAVQEDPSLDANTFKRRIRDHMLQYFDPIFVTRQIVIVPEIVRTPTGKIDRASLQSLREKVKF